MTLTPAYGRDYKSAKTAKADFDANKDFMVSDFTGRSALINKEQIDKGKTVTIRYNNLRNLAIVKV